MTPEAWILLLGVAVPIIGSIIIIYVTLSGRLTRIETIFEFVGLEALKTLHSDDNHLGLDAFIDHMTEEYEKHNYDLSDDQWEQFLLKLKDVPTNEKATSMEQKTAKMIYLLCKHKLMRSGRLGKIEQEIGTKLI